MRIEAPYHDGELLVQERVGELEEGRRNAAAISDSIVKGALRFIAQQSMVVLGSLDRDENVWASVMFGQPGFMEVDGDRAVLFDLSRAVKNPHEPFLLNIEREPRVGMLVIELATRRRIRINGRMTRIGTDRLRLDVDEAYPNCPKFIQRRENRNDWSTTGAEIPEPMRGRELQSSQRQLIESADTFFVASANPRGGVDASHRGGDPGFIKVLDNRTLRIPDYRGNSMFNTLGNFVSNPRAGIVIVDFAGRNMLQLIGRPEIQWDLDDTDNETGGTRRYWDLHIEQSVETVMPFKQQWEFVDHSPHNPKPPAEASA